MSQENTGTAGRPASVTNNWSLMDLLILLVGHKRLIVRTSLILALLAAVAVYFVPNQYVSETVILPPNQGSSAGANLLSQLAGGASSVAALAGGGLGIRTTGDMYVALFRTDKVEDAVIKRFDLQKRYKKKFESDTRKALESRTTVALGTKDGLIRVTARDIDPKFAADLANGYVEEFRRLFADLAVTEAAQRRMFFENQMKQAKDNLANAEVAMKNAEQSTGVLQIDSQARVLIESAASLRAQIAAKQVQIQAMRSFAADENPEIVIARQQLNALQAQLSSLLGPGREGDPDLVIAKGRVPEAGMTYVRKLRDMKYYETIYELIARQLEIAKMDEARQGAIVQVVDEATPADKKSSPKRTITVLGVFVVSCFLLSIYVFLREFLRQLVKDSRWSGKTGALRSALDGKKN